MTMTVLAPERGAAAAADRAAPAQPDGGTAARGVPALLAPIPVPGTPLGTFTPGVAAAGAERDSGRVARITRIAHAVPGKPDGEVDTRPLQPIWRVPARSQKAKRAKPEVIGVR